MPDLLTFHPVMRSQMLALLVLTAFAFASCGDEAGELSPEPDVVDVDADPGDIGPDPDAPPDATDPDLADASPQPTLLDEPLGVLPQRLSEVGLYPALPDRGQVDSRAHRYAPQYELWTNGSGKERFIVLPAAFVVDTSERGAWAFPPGTLLFKTFTYPDNAFPGGERPVETRLIRRAEAGWDLAVYQWNAEGTEGLLLDLAAPVPVAVATPEAGPFDHQIPSRLQCRACHEADPRFVIGFNELQLNAPLAGADGTQLADFAALGLFSEPVPEAPEAIQAEDELTREVLGMIQGNCVHCHNGSETPLSQFDMRHPVFLENTVNAPSQRWAGLRIAPGDPEASGLYLAMTGDTAGPADMPPLGVQVRDTDAIDDLRAWIEGLPTEE